MARRGSEAPGLTNSKADGKGPPGCQHAEWEGLKQAKVWCTIGWMAGSGDRRRFGKGDLTEKEQAQVRRVVKNIVESRRLSQELQELWRSRTEMLQWFAPRMEWPFRNLTIPIEVDAAEERSDS